MTENENEEKVEVDRPSLFRNHSASDVIGRFFTLKRESRFSKLVLVLVLVLQNKTKK
jgi:hypothetical protein